MSSKASIPSPGGDPFGEAVKQNLDRITGQHPNTRPLPQLSTDATLAELVVAYNLLLARVQGD
jgi:hypothetical protein